MPFITQGKTNWKFLLIVIILAIIVGGGALWYAKKTGQPYQSVEIKKSESSNLKTYNTGNFSFKYSDNMWQLGDKDLFEDYRSNPIKQKEAYFNNKQIENCEVWLGIDAGEGVCKTVVYALKSECYDDEVVECIGPSRLQEDRIELNNDFFSEREIEGSTLEERIQVWYSIHDKKSNDVYCATLITLPDDPKKKCAAYEGCPSTVLIQECLDNFEQILKTLKFK